VTANDDGNPDCDVVVEDPEVGGRGDGEVSYHYIIHCINDALELCMIID